MKHFIVMTCAGLALMAGSGAAGAKGCISGAAVGGVAGHVAGKHAVLGAAAGCAINHHREKVNDQKAAAAARQPTVAPAPAAPAAPPR